MGPIIVLAVSSVMRAIPGRSNATAKRKGPSDLGSIRKLLCFLTKGITAEQMQRWRKEVVGIQVKDFGVIQSREALAGLLRHDLGAFLTHRRGVLVLFLRLIGREAGVTRGSAYPIEPEGRRRLRQVLGSNEGEFIRGVNKAGPTVTAGGRPGVTGTLRRRLSEMGEGRTVSDFGEIESFEMSSDAIPAFQWKQTCCVRAARKRGRLLLWLEFQYRAPGKSGFDAYPLDEKGRARLRDALAQVDEIQNQDETSIRIPAI